jgi:adenylyl-sulfate kinase
MLARGLDDELSRAGLLSGVLDGDELRRGLNADLGFSKQDRSENVRRTGEVARLFSDAGLIVIAALISPFRQDRERVRAIIGADRLLEVFVDAPLDVCERRDVKGLYARARSGALRELTGVSSPYESPEAPDVVVRTAECTPDQGVAQVLGVRRRRGLLPASVAWC